LGSGAAAFIRFASEGWWTWQDSNLQPGGCQQRDKTRSLILQRFRLNSIAFVVFR